jgi:galactitol-specific phosphotransferase system IIC component
MLKTFAVVVMVVVLVTEFFKEAVDKLFNLVGWHVPTKYVVFFWALFIIFGPLYYEGTITGVAIFMGVLNAIFVSLAAMKLYESILEKAFGNFMERMVLKYNASLAVTDETRSGNGPCSGGP